LVLQTILPALLTAPAPTSITIDGGTHNPMAPPYDFLELVFFPLLRRMGPRIECFLERPGFYPAGGGRIRARVEPPPNSELARLDLLERGALLHLKARAVVAGLPAHVAVREIRVLQRELGLAPEATEVVEVEDARGPGNVVVVYAGFEGATELVSGFGEKGLAAEKVALGVAAETKEFIEAGVPVGRHLADQLLIPMVLAGGGSFLTLEPTGHTRTNADVIRAFVDARFQMERVSDRGWKVEVAVPGAPSGAGGSDRPA
jgi:RNA 3'-terminal phosphate cyclase (ATP)